MKALRILLRSIETAALKYGRHIRPLLSLSIDFYVRVFVQVFTSPLEAKLSASTTAMVYNCHGCQNFHLQPFGRTEPGQKGNVKHGFAVGPPVDTHCGNCGSTFHVGGPIWAGRLHDADFVELAQRRLETSLLDPAEERSTFGTYKRMKGILQVVSEELPDQPLYYVAGQFGRLLRCVLPTLPAFRSAIMNAGYQVSYSHANPISVKTNAPAPVLWDIMTVWARSAEAQEKTTAGEKVQTEQDGDAMVDGPAEDLNCDAQNGHRPEKSQGCKDSPLEKMRQRLLERQVHTEVSFELHDEEQPLSKTQHLVRYQVNPTKNWGPKPRVKPLADQESLEDRRTRNQGKRKLKELAGEQTEKKPNTLPSE